jgi:hypothetical protein
MPPTDTPYLCELPQHGAITVAETGAGLPFEVKRVYWIKNGAEEVARGGHCHVQSTNALVCLQGSLTVHTTGPEGTTHTHHLASEHTLLVIPPRHWLTLTLSPQAVVLALSSMVYQEEDYIRDKEVFLNLPKT